jgi:hypothetical protein
VSVRVTHPFHPLSGREFEFVKRRRTWGEDQVFFYGPGGVLTWLPAEWTDAVAEDPFVAAAAGRAPFRTADLLELAALVDGLRPAPPPGARGVKKSTP